MGNGLIAFLIAGGAFMWVYNKIMRTSGNNVKNAVIVASTAAVLALFIVLIVLKMVPSV